MNVDTLILLWLPFGLIHVVGCYDGYTTCSKPYRNSRTWSDLPCDFKHENWCVLPGTAYPWHAVRRFVFENHGLMKRMYGEQRHFSVLRAEIDINDLEFTTDGWHGYNEGSFKKYQRPNPIILRQTFSRSPAAAFSTTSSSTIASTTTTLSAMKNTIPDNSTIAEITFSTENEKDLTITTDGMEYDTIISEELPMSTSTTAASTTASSAGTETSKITQPLFFQENTSELPAFRLKGINACPVKEEIVAPFWANNTRGEILALLNLYPFEQYVHWERCSHEYKQMYCRQGCQCEQQYRLHRLLAYDPTNDCRGIFSDWFKFPSCCVCKCYDIATEFKQTSRSPRGPKEIKHFPPYFPIGWND